MPSLLTSSLQQFATTLLGINCFSSLRVLVKMHLLLRRWRNPALACQRKSADLLSMKQRTRPACERYDAPT